jgi:hypothetical protein
MVSVPGPNDFLVFKICRRDIIVLTRHPWKIRRAGFHLPAKDPYYCTDVNRTLPHTSPAANVRGECRDIFPVVARA